MAFGSVSNSKLHCCLVILILFILVFLSLPLLLIYLANTRFEETWMRQNATLENNGTCPSSGPDGAGKWGGRKPQNHLACSQHTLSRQAGERLTGSAN